MTDRTQGPTQWTRPKKGRPIDIPIPTRETVGEAFAKLAHAPDPGATRRSDARPESIVADDVRRAIGAAQPASGPGVVGPEHVANPADDAPGGLVGHA